MPTLDKLQHYYTCLEDEFNLRQLHGEDCDDLVALMINVIFTLRETGRWATGNGRDYVH